MKRYVQFRSKTLISKSESDEGVPGPGHCGPELPVSTRPPKPGFSVTTDYILMPKPCLVCPKDIVTMILKRHAEMTQVLPTDPIVTVTA